MSKKLKFRKFDSADWDAFSGAEEVPGGPLIAGSTMRGKDVTIIVDADMIAIYEDNEEGYAEGYNLQIPFPAGKIIAFHLESPIDPRQLIDFGFKKL